MLAELSSDFFSMIVNIDKLVMYVGGNAKIFLFGLLGQYFIHLKDF